MEVFRVKRIALFMIYYLSLFLAFFGSQAEWIASGARHRFRLAGFAPGACRVF